MYLNKYRDLNKVVGTGDGLPLGLDKPAHIIDNSIELSPIEARFDA